MAWVDIVLMLALVQYVVIILQVGRARGLHNIPAPQMSGHPIVERWFRVQGNTLEMLIIFIPALWTAARYWRPEYVAGIGAVFIVGRALYSRGYVQDPKNRSLGFLLSGGASVILILASLIGAVRTLF